VLAVLGTSITEAVAALLKTRSKTLDGWLKENLTESKLPRQDNESRRDAEKRFADVSPEAIRAAGAVFRHPSVNGLTRNGKAPSYVPSDHLVTALLDVGATLKHNADALKPDAQIAYATVTGTAREIGDALGELPDSPIRDALLQEWKRSGKDVQKFRAAAEKWFDDAMDRLSGWYKRRVQLFLWIFGLAIAILFNVDAINIARTLWNDPGLRDALVNQAGNAHASVNSGVGSAYDQLQHLPLPLGWGGDAGGAPTGWGIPLKVLGILITAAAAGMGAPFWFDTLSRLGSLRGTGPKPATTSASAAPAVTVKLDTSAAVAGQSGGEG
jgi:hypothetical protein